MSGIFGVLYRDGRAVDPADLHRISDRLRHRGPDGAGIWHRGSIGLGHRLLHTTPESLRETWPIVSTSDDIVLVADARIDNREELASMLGLPLGVVDGELIIAAYQRWGREAPEKLIGDFAFGIWDAKRGTLFCARDPMGLKRLSYYSSHQLFAFASETKGLFCLPEIPREVDEVQIGYFLDYFRDDQERTFYRGVRRLPAAHWLEVDANGVRTGKYWEADSRREIRYSTSEQYVEAFREHFTEAVRCRLRSALPVGSALSGGLDSAAIVCMARRLMDRQRPLHVVSAVFPGLPEPYLEWNDETRYIEAVTAQEGIVEHRVRADELSMFDYLDRMFWYHDAPPFGFMYWMRWAVYETAASNRVRVFFSGDDGDTVVSHGYERFNDLAREGLWTSALAELEALGLRTESSPVALSQAYLQPRLVALARAGMWSRWREGSREIARNHDQSALRLMTRTAADAFVPAGFFRLSRKLRGQKISRSLVSPRFARRIDLEERERALRNVHPHPIPTARESHAMVLPSPMLQHIMETTDSMASAFSMETRCPFLDRRLIEYSLAIPTEQKLAEGWTRLILRKAMEGILPPEVQWRVHKADLTYNFVRRLLENDRQALVESLFEKPEVLEDYVDMDWLKQLHNRFENNRFRGARGTSGRLYTAAILARWLRKSGRETLPEPTGSPA